MSRNVPLEFLQHNYPLVGVLGLKNDFVQSESEKTLSSDLWTSFEECRQRLLETLVARNSMIESTSNIAPLPKLVSLQSSSGIKVPHVKYVFLQDDYLLPQCSTKPYSSNISPGNPASPLYPDGLMSIDWILRHSKYLPASLICFVPLPRLESNIKVNPLEPLQADVKMCQVINDIRRKIIGNRALVKFVVILLTDISLNDSVVEERSLFIKKACNLENKNTFFMLSSSANSNFTEYFESFEKTLFEYCSSYYKELGRKAKKKKSRGNQTSFKPSIVSSQNAIGIHEWNIRYDYKMATYAELMQDHELAVRHFITAYNMLMEYFKDIRNKEAVHNNANAVNVFFVRAYSARWNEALLFFDSISFKISKYLLFSMSPIDGLFQLNRHINFMKSIRIGLGEQMSKSFGFWGWASRQYYLFAELISVYTSLKLILPKPLFANDTAADASYLISEIPASFCFDLTDINSIHGNIAKDDTVVGLLHSGFYYLIAGKCMISRMKSFNLYTQENPQKQMTNDVFNHHRSRDDIEEEKTFDHSTRAIDILTRSYESFKKGKQSRFTFYLADLIAQIYMQNGKYEMALKFFERISKTYRREKWNIILEPILERTFICAKHCKSWTIAFSTISELMTEICSDRSRRRQWYQEFRTLLDSIDETKLTVPYTVSAESNNLFLSASALFGKQTYYVGDNIDIQILIFGNSAFLPITICNVMVQFSNYSLNLEISHDENVYQKKFSFGENTHSFCACMPSRENAQQQKKFANLSFVESYGIILSTSISVNHPQEIKITDIALDFGDGKFQLRFPFTKSKDAIQSNIWFLKKQDSAKDLKLIKYDSTRIPHIIRVNHRKPEFKMALSYEKPGLYGEKLSVKVNIINGEKETMRAYLSVKIKYDSLSTDEKDEKNFDVIQVTGQGPKGKSIDSLDIGLIPKDKECKVDLEIDFNEKRTGLRNVIFIVLFRLANEQSTADLFGSKNPSSGFYSELSETIHLEVYKPFEIVCTKSSFEKFGNGNTCIMTIENTCSVPLILKNLSLLKDNQKPISTQEAKEIKLDPRKTVNFVVEAEENDLYELIWSRMEILKDLCLRYGISFQQDQFDRMTSVKLEYPGYAQLNYPSCIHYHIENLTSRTIDIIVQTDICDTVVYAGYKQLSVKLLPKDKVSIPFHCWFLLAGEIFPPSIRTYLKVDGQLKEISGYSNKSILVI